MSNQTETEPLYLIYINHLGTNWREHNIYEFLFSNIIDPSIEGEDWDVYPASNGNVTPPKEEYIKYIGVIETELDLLVIRDSETFSVWDCVDGIVPLGYENIVDYEEYPKHRLIFNYGVTLDVVNKLAYGRDITLNLKKIE
jgi:hypothetical protein